MYMHRPFAVVTTLVLAVFFIWASAHAQTGSQPDKGTKTKGILPAGWKKLNLSQAQKDKAYGIQSEYKAKIKKLEMEIAELKSAEHTAMVAVLTDAQKAQLAKDLGLEVPKVDPNPEKK